MIDPDLLDHFPPFAALGGPARRELAARAVTKRYRSGARLFSLGDEARGLFLVLRGTVRVTRETAGGGRRFVVHEESRGGTLGEIPLFAGGAYPATAEAATDVECIIVGRDALHAAMRVDPQLAWVLLERLSLRVRVLIDRLEDRVRLPVTARLARHLLRRLGETGAHTITLGLTQAALAEELGTVREVVVKALRELRSAGAVRPAGRGRLELTDVPLLRALAGG